MYYRVLVASPRFHGRESLTYASPTKLSVGQLVAVALQNKAIIGIVESRIGKPDFPTKTITNSWDVDVPVKSLMLLKWLKDYYPAPLGLITELFTPPSLPKKLPEPLDVSAKQIAAKLPTLTSEQKKTLVAVEKFQGQSVLLHGDTGTGKTRIYVELAKLTLASGKSAIVLTPEIGLTKPMLDTFAKTFGSRVLVTHSEMTPAQRRSVWLAANKNKGGVIVIGPRSALFSPLKDIGLIILDEAHDNAYKQEQSPYYQSTRVAAQLARLHNATLVLGSATPSITDYYTFQQKNLPIVRMSEQAINTTQTTDLHVIDHRNKANFTKSPWLANNLLAAIQTAIENNEQSLLFLNRRGSARLVMCEQCGWQALCPHCDVALTYHQDAHIMRCHSCDYSGKVPTNCPVCNASELVFRSIGTKALETELARIFPRARISRFDRDTDKLLRLHQQYQSLHAGEVDIVIGTQTITKGLDLPKLSVVCIVQADSGLQIPDFTATERTYQLLSQVGGRIGRGHRAGKLFVQTYEPDSPLIAKAIQKDYLSFYEHELAQRQTYSFPPYTYLLKISCSRASSRSAMAACQKITEMIRTTGLQVRTEGPSPRFIEKANERYTWHIVVKSKQQTNLIKIIDSLPGNCTYDLDPSDLL